MGKRYYCDFCDKAFADNPTSRKNHINGTTHQLLRKAHYDNFLDPASLLVIEAVKQPCRKFMQTGECAFGSSCRHSHLSDQQKKDLEEQCRQLAASKRPKPFTETSVVGELDEWLAKRAKKSKPEDTANNTKQPTIPEFSLPLHLAGVPNLPPSLFPPGPKDFVNLPYLAWG